MSRRRKRPSKGQKGGGQLVRRQGGQSSSCDKDPDGKKTSWGKIVRDVINFVVSVATLVSVVIAACQIHQSTQQFIDSGARYDMYYVDIGEQHVSDDANWRQNVQSVVLTNTGRTTGSVVAAEYKGRKDKVSLCTPDFDDNGDYVDGSARVTGDWPISLEPSASALVFSIDKPTKSSTTTIKVSNDKIVVKGGGRFSISDEFRLFESRGRKPQVVKIRQDAPVQTVDHYKALNGYRDARSACIDAANASTGDLARMGSD